MDRDAPQREPRPYHMPLPPPPGDRDVPGARPYPPPRAGEPPAPPPAEPSVPGRHTAGEPADDQRRLWQQGAGKDLAESLARSAAQTRPIADELFRAGTSPDSGETLVHRHHLSIGCAGGLVAELMLAHRQPGQPAAEPLLTTVVDRVSGRRLLRVRRHLYDQAPPRDSLAHHVIDVIVADAEQTGARPVAEMLEYLAAEAYVWVGERLARAGLMVERQRRRGLRTQRVWLPARYRTDSIHALMRLPSMLRLGEPISEADRVLLGLMDAVNLRSTMKREAGLSFPWPASLRLHADLNSVVDVTRTVVELTTRSRGR